MKSIIKVLFILSLSFNCYGQDFIRIGAGHDFKKDKVVQTFSFDFNRTEEAKEKTAKALLFKNDYYITPTADVNIGDGITSSENNVMAQMIFGKGFYGEPKASSRDANMTYAWNKAFEINPSYNADKIFEERLLYGQLKFLISFISAKKAVEDLVYVKNAHSITGGVYTNIGYRYSKVYDPGHNYLTVGVLLDYKTRILNELNEENWVYKISGNYYRITSDVDEITSDDFGGIIKSSVDRRLFGKAYAGVAYKYGNDNPKYAYVHTLELSFKIKY